MSDHTANGMGQQEAHHAPRAPHAEFYVYFTLIFIVAIPFAAVAWIYMTISERKLPTHGPLARAWREAGAITPAIFRA